MQKGTQSMNIFDKLVAKEYAGDTRLGCPARDYVASARRHQAMYAMRGGKGFRTPPSGVKLSKNGTTRKQREAHFRPIYLKNLEAELAFRENMRGQPIAKIRDAIERGDHLK